MKKNTTVKKSAKALRKEKEPDRSSGSKTEADCWVRPRRSHQATAPSAYVRPRLYETFNARNL
jgi:hypothetical protein